MPSLIKKNRQIDTESSRNTITIPLWKALSIVATAVLTTVVASAFASMRVLNSDHFVLAALGQKVEAIESDYIREDQFDTFEKRLDRIEAKIDRLIEAK